MGNPAQIDKIDRRILRALDQKPGASGAEIARITGLSRNTVQARLKRLENSDAMAAPSMRIHPSSLGYPVLAFVTLELVQGAPRQVTEHLQKVPEILDVYAVTGDGDMVARVAARDTSDLFRITQEMLRAPGILRTRSMIAINEVVPPRMGPLLRSSALDDDA